jgi:hypothetical protein
MYVGCGFQISASFDDGGGGDDDDDDDKDDDNTDDRGKSIRGASRSMKHCEALKLSKSVFAVDLCPLLSWVDRNLDLADGGSSIDSDGAARKYSDQLMDS